MLSSLLNSIGQFGQDALGVVPTDTCVGDGNSVFETRLSFLGHLLVAFADVRFDHDAHDGFFARGDLGGEFVGDLWLVHVVLFRVAVAVCLKMLVLLLFLSLWGLVWSKHVPAVDHESRLGEANLLELLL
jgi:hypothetical protein